MQPAPQAAPVTLSQGSLVVPNPDLFSSKVFFWNFTLSKLILQLMMHEATIYYEFRSSKTFHAAFYD
jgi:hypothetical protein